MADVGTLIAALIKLGGPYVVSAVFVALYFLERKSKEDLARQLYELGVQMAKTNAEFTGALRNVERDLEAIRRNL